MDLSTTYLGMELRTPLVPSASPLSERVDNIKRMEDAGAAAVVLHSLFEEQLRAERSQIDDHVYAHYHTFAEAVTFFPQAPDYRLTPDQYLEHIRKAKAAVDIPIIASLNATSMGWWTSYAAKIEQAGADAVELNIYHIPTDPDMPSAVVEEMYIEIVRGVKSALTIPVAVKLSPYFSNMANMARRLDAAGADALVLFNRFYQPDIDLDSLDVRPHILLSTPQELRLPLRWIAILYGRVRADLAATTGIYGAEDVLKMLMAGANVTMMTSALLRHGIAHLRTVERDLNDWMERNEYISVRQMHGSISQRKSEDPSAFERAQYIKALQTYTP